MTSRSWSNKSVRPPISARRFRIWAASSDADRQLTVIAVNAFFNGDGRKLFTGPYDRLYDALTRFLGDQTRATSLSLDVRDVTYAELRLIAEGRDDIQTATELQAKLAEMPDAVENYLLILNPSPYWRRLAIRLPQMVKTAARVQPRRCRRRASGRQRRAAGVGRAEPARQRGTAHQHPAGRGHRRRRRSDQTRAAEGLRRTLATKTEYRDSVVGPQFGRRVSG